MSCASATAQAVLAIYCHVRNVVGGLRFTLQNGIYPCAEALGLLAATVWPRAHLCSGWIMPCMDLLAPDEAELDAAWVALQACAAAAAVPRSAAATTDAFGGLPGNSGGSAVVTAHDVEEPSLGYRQACQVAIRIRTGNCAPPGL